MNAEKGKAGFITGLSLICIVDHLLLRGCFQLRPFGIEYFNASILMRL